MIAYILQMRTLWLGEVTRLEWGHSLGQRKDSSQGKPLQSQTPLLGENGAGEAWGAGGLLAGGRACACTWPKGTTWVTLTWVTLT